MDVLTVKVSLLETDVPALKKDVLSVVKATNAAANKVDKLKKVVDLLTKWVLKLEK